MTDDDDDDCGAGKSAAASRSVQADNAFATPAHLVSVDATAELTAHGTLPFVWSQAITRKNCLLCRCCRTQKRHYFITTSYCGLCHVLLRCETGRWRTQARSGGPDFSGRGNMHE